MEPTDGGGEYEYGAGGGRRMDRGSDGEDDQDVKGVVCEYYIADARTR